jgi:uncharacterized protein
MTIFNSLRAICLAALLIAENANCQNFSSQRLSDSTLTLVSQKVFYDPSYFQLSYPNGDVPPDKGVCTDVIIRAYRKTGIDLQKEIHEDMRVNFDKYPRMWGLTRPDRNIDHRRVPNLMTFFSRFGKTLPVTLDPDDFHPGDIVTWDLGAGVKHIGLVVNRRSDDGKRFLIVHNIGTGQVLEDFLFSYPINGHFQYSGK